MANSATRRGVDGWRIGLWAAQLILAFLFFYAGLMKLTRTPAGLAKIGWAWALTIPAGFIFFIGIMEILAAIGILLPAALRILPWLTPAAAGGMVIIQLAAVALHTMRGEIGNLGFNLPLLALALFALWGRLAKRPIAAK